MVEAATGCTSALERRIAALDRRVAENALPAGKAVPTLCRALAAYVARDWHGAIALLEFALPLPGAGRRQQRAARRVPEHVVRPRSAMRPARVRAIASNRASLHETVGVDVDLHPHVAR